MSTLGAAASLLWMRRVPSLQGFSAAPGGRSGPLALGLTLATLGAGVLSGCSGTSKSGSSGTPSPQAIEREENSREAASLKGEEAQEVAKERELLSVLESKKREEAAAEAAKRTLAAADAKAKRRERAADRAVKRKEREATEAAAKRKAAEQKKPAPVTKKPAVKQPKPSSTEPKESIATPPTVTVPSGGN